MSGSLKGLTQDQAAWTSNFVHVPIESITAASGSGDPGMVSYPGEPDDAGQLDQDTVDARPVFGPKEGWTLETIVITPENPSLVVEGKQQFTARGRYADGHEQDETDALTWTSSDTAILAFDDSKKGLAVAGTSTGVVMVVARDPNGKASAQTEVNVEPNTSDAPDDMVDEGEAYRMGLADGKYDDAVNWQTKFQGRDDLQSAYAEGYKKSHDEADKEWDKVGAEVDEANMPKRPDGGGGVPVGQMLDGAGIVGSIISIIEANGARALSRGVVGTTIGAILLPIFAFKLGTDIREKHDERKKARQDFLDKFWTITFTDALTRCRAMLKAAKVTSTDLNDDGKVATTTRYEHDRGELQDMLESYLDDDKNEEAYIALYKTWVQRLAKEWAKFAANPRFHG